MLEHHVAPIPRAGTVFCQLVQSHEHEDAILRGVRLLLHEGNTWKDVVLLMTEFGWSYAHAPSVVLFLVDSEGIDSTGPIVVPHWI